MQTKKFIALLGFLAICIIPLSSVFAQADMGIPPPERDSGEVVDIDDGGSMFGADLLTDEDPADLEGEDGAAEDPEDIFPDFLPGEEEAEDPFDEDAFFGDDGFGAAEEDEGEDMMMGDEEDTDDMMEIVDESDVVAPTVISAEADDINTIVVTFSEEVLLPSEDPEAEFSITEEFDPTSMLLVDGAEVDEEDRTQIWIYTDDQEKGTSYTLIVSANITDLAGNPIVSGITDTATFEGTNKMPEEEMPDTEIPEEEEEEDEFIPPPDVTPPEDVTNLILSFEKELDKFLINLSWIPSLNSAGDLIDQLLYTSLDKGITYDTGKSLGPEAKKKDLHNMEGGKEYTFKITTKDLAGNESTGVVKSIRLPQTGPFVAFGLALSAIISGIVVLRKKNK